jgi:hypothetical protein
MGWQEEHKIRNWDIIWWKTCFSNWSIYGCAIVSVQVYHRICTVQNVSIGKGERDRRTNTRLKNIKSHEETRDGGIQHEISTTLYSALDIIEHHTP